MILKFPGILSSTFIRIRFGYSYFQCLTNKISCWSRKQKTFDRTDTAHFYQRKRRHILELVRISSGRLRVPKEPKDVIKREITFNYFSKWSTEYDSDVSDFDG